MATALVALAEGFEEIEFVAVVDILRRGGVDVAVASVAGPLEVAGAHGISMRADCALAKLDGMDFDAIILPGGSKGTDNLLASEAIKERLVRQQQRDGLICAICAAPKVLIAAGILEPDVHITCHPSCASEIDRPYAEAPVVEDGRIITGRAAGSAVLFALVVLKNLAGEEIVRRVAAGLVTPWP